MHFQREPCQLWWSFTISTVCFAFWTNPCSASVDQGRPLTSIEVLLIKLGTDYLCNSMGLSRWNRTCCFSFSSSERKAKRKKSIAIPVFLAQMNPTSADWEQMDVTTPAVCLSSLWKKSWWRHLGQKINQGVRTRSYKNVLVLFLIGRVSWWICHVAFRNALYFFIVHLITSADWGLLCGKCQQWLPKSPMFEIRPFIHTETAKY